jgi:D-alanyl-D-alanine carboxypeptidase/D-alanyl-D-alanine-endopeptidase (penicillin-binding protein 4)
VGSYRRVVLAIAAVVAAVGATAGTVAYNAARSPAAPARGAAPATATAAPTTVPPFPETPPPSPLALAADPAAGTPATAAGVARALAKALADKALGARVNALVVDAATGATLYDRGSGAAVVPASTAKLFTAAAALRALGPDRTFETKVVATGPIENGVLTGDLVVVGGGDPTLTAATGPTAYPHPARLADLARAVRARGVRRVTGALVVDATLFSGPGLARGWKPTYVSEGSVAPVSAFEVDGGRLRPDDDDRSSAPDLLAGGKLRDALRRAGVAVATVRRGRAATVLSEVATVRSPPVSALVERLLTRSDNDLAEALARHVAIARGAGDDFAGAAGGVAATVQELGVVPPPALADGSGLSPRDRATPAQLVALLRLATTDAALAPVLSGLPVARFTGTLSTRYDKGAATRAAGLVRAKTGSLDNVSTLAGVVETRSGRLLVFAFAADRLPSRFPGTAARALDVAAAALV